MLRGSPYYDHLWKTYTQTVKCFGVLAVTAIVCLLVDSEDSPTPWLSVPLAFFLLMSVFRVARGVWILELIIKVVSSSTPSEPR